MTDRPFTASPQENISSPHVQGLPTGPRGIYAPAPRGHTPGASGPAPDARGPAPGPHAPAPHVHVPVPGVHAEQDAR